MLVAKISSLVFLFYISIVSYAQDNQIGIGFDFSIQKEPLTDQYPFPLDIDINSIHYDFIPNFKFIFSNKISIGIFGGVGYAKGSIFNINLNQKEYLESRSSEIGLLWKYNFLEINRLKGYVQNNLRFKKFKQYLLVHEKNSQFGKFLIGDQEISSIDINLRLGCSYQLFDFLFFDLFISNDILSRETIRGSAFSNNSPTDRWMLFKDYLIFGTGISYIFGKR